MPRYCRACRKELSGRKIYYCNNACRDDYYRREGYMLPDWPEKSARFIKTYPVCQNCGIAPSTETHHRVPRRLGGTDDDENLMAACSKCHKNLDNAIILKERRRVTIAPKPPRTIPVNIKAVQLELPLEV